MPGPSLLQRLKERKFVQWALAYLAGAFAVSQLVDALETPLGLSATIQQAILAVLVIGFFVTLVLAWYHGEKGRQAVGGIEALLLLGLFGGVGIVLWGTQRGSPSEKSTLIPAVYSRIAVLPFVDLDSTDTGQSFGEGIADGILSALATIPGLDVLDRQSSFQPEVSSADLGAIGEMLEVEVVVRGEVDEVRDSLRFTVNLSRTEDAAELWREDFRWDWTQFSSLDEVAWRIAEVLLRGPAGDSPPSSGPSGQRSQEAWFLYWEGIRAANEGTRPGLEQAVGYFDAATQVDEEFALAYAGLANAYLDLASDRPALVMVGQVVSQALRLDSTLAEAHVVRGRLLNQPGSWIEAEGEFRTAIGIQPSNAPAHMWLGNNLLVRGRTAEGLLEFQRARELDPRSPSIAVGLSQALSATGDLDGAIAEARRATTVNPVYGYGHSALAVALAEVGDFEEAIGEANLAVQLLEEDPNALATLAAIQAKAGNTSGARTILERLRGQAGTRSFLATALAYAALSEADSAFAFLHRVPSWNPPDRDWLRNSPVWGPIRTDPRWAGLLSSLGLN